MKIVIIGCGRLGASLAIDAAEQGHRVTIVDKEPRSFNRLPEDLRASVVLGTGIDEDVLRSAGVETTDTFIAVTDNDNTNIMAAQIADRIFDVENVMLRVYDPVRADTYQHLGLTVFCPTRLVADLIEEALPGFRARSVEAGLSS